LRSCLPKAQRKRHCPQPPAPALLHAFAAGCRDHAIPVCAALEPCALTQCVMPHGQARWSPGNTWSVLLYHRGDANIAPLQRCLHDAPRRSRMSPFRPSGTLRALPSVQRGWALMGPTARHEGSASVSPSRLRLPAQRLQVMSSAENSDVPIRPSAPPPLPRPKGYSHVPRVTVSPIRPPYLRPSTFKRAMMSTPLRSHNQKLTYTHPGP